MLNFDTIFLLLVVALIFQRLWSVLGTRPEQPVKKIKLSRENAQEICKILRKEAEKALGKESDEEEYTVENPKILTDLEAVLMAIPLFDKDLFMNGAKKAFEVITTAFNKGDEQTLKMLVSSAIFKKMQEVINQRKTDEMSAETDFICFDKAEITKALIENKKAKITVEFVSQQVNVLRNKDGEVVEGDENYIQTITDVWTFEKNVDPKEINWILISTKK